MEIDHINEINNCKLEDLIFEKNGVQKKASKKDVKEFKFVGLSNIWFARGKNGANNLD